MMSRQLSVYIRKKAFAEGAILTGTAKIRIVEPVLVIAVPFTDQWFLKSPLKETGMLAEAARQSRHILNVCGNILKNEGFTARFKTIWSLYGDFRPLAVAADLGEWGRSGIVVNKDYGAGLLFAAIFTNAPLLSSHPNSRQRHCSGCSRCVNSCPYQAFDKGRFNAARCLQGTLFGCAECLTVCNGRT